MAASFILVSPHASWLRADLIRTVPSLARQALVRAAHDYAGNKISSGGTVAQGAESIVGRRFKGAGNGRFTPLSMQYAAWKAKRLGKKPILVRTGLLKDSAIGHGRVRLVGTMVEIVFMVPDYWKFHHEGKGRLPKRSPVEPNTSDITAVQNSARRHFDALVKLWQLNEGCLSIHSS